jgi:hypothetical protein
MQLIEKKLAPLQETHLVFVDLKNAYDSIPINKLWEALENSGINTQIIQAVKILYTGSVSKIKIGNKLSDGLPVTNGLRQDCLFLQNYYLEQAFGLWKRKSTKNFWE